MSAMLNSDGLAIPCEPGTGRKYKPLQLILRDKAFCSFVRGI